MRFTSVLGLEVGPVCLKKKEKREVMKLEIFPFAIGFWQLC